MKFDHIELRFSFLITTSAYGDFDRCSSDMTIDLIGVQLADSADKETLIAPVGRILASYKNLLSAGPTGAIDMFSAVDSVDYEDINLIYKDGSFSRNDLGIDFLNSVLIISEFYLLPEYRGNDHGSKVFKALVEFFGEFVDAIVLRSAPLQFCQETTERHQQEGINLGLQDKTDKSSADAALLKFYKGLGMTEYPKKSRLMWLCTEYRNRKLERVSYHE